jgi:hypothetical protein
MKWGGWLPTLLAQLTRLTMPCTYYGDQAFFAERRFFTLTGGFPEVPLLEDVLWIRAAARMGKAIRSPRFATTSARRFERDGVVRQSLLNLRILTRERWGGASPGELAPLYRDWVA